METAKIAETFVSREVEIVRRRRTRRRKIFDQMTSWLFVMPVVLGILLFTLVPMVSSLVYSFTEYSLLNSDPTEFVGFDNFVKIFTSDWNNFGTSLANTFIYTFVSLPMTLVLSFSLGLLLAKQMPGIKIFRALIYLPVMIPAVVSGLLWADILDYEMGVVNMIFKSIGLQPYGFFSTEATSLPTFIMMGLFGVGGGMILWIAQIKAIPDAMMESAQIEGAGYFTKLFKIIIPMCTPMIFYNLVLGIIGSLQVFAAAYVLATPATGAALNFMTVYIYNTAFSLFSMSYACAMSWILFLIIGIFTLIVFKTGGWVYYGEGE